MMGQDASERGQGFREGPGERRDSPAEMHLEGAEEGGQEEIWTPLGREDSLEESGMACLFMRGQGDRGGVQVSEAELET